MKSCVIQHLLLKQPRSLVRKMLIPALSVALNVSTGQESLSSIFVLLLCVTYSIFPLQFMPYKVYNILWDNSKSPYVTLVYFSCNTYKYIDLWLLFWLSLKFHFSLISNLCFTVSCCNNQTAS